jgi:hypothetical protein
MSRAKQRLNKTSTLTRKQREEHNKKMRRFIRTCFYANSLEKSDLVECLKTGVMPNYPKNIEQEFLESHYTENKIETELVTCRASETDKMALENILHKKFGRQII